MTVPGEEKRATTRMQQFGTASDSVWTPDPSEWERSRLGNLARRLGCRTIDTLHSKAIHDSQWFWEEVVRDLDIGFEPPYRTVLDESMGHEFPRWFTGGGCNIVTRCLIQQLADHGDRVAVAWEGEDGARAELTYRELAAQAQALAGFLASSGIEKGDRVGVVLPNLIEAATTFLACSWLGAIAVPIFSGYGPEAVASRLLAAEAKAVVTADGQCRRGERLSILDNIAPALANCGSLATVIVVHRFGAPKERTSYEWVLDGRGSVTSWEDALAIGRGAPELSVASTETNDPVLIVYTSGTTGAPKGIVLTQGGFLIKVGVDFGYGKNLQAGDSLCFMTDFGWIMGPELLMGCLMFGATMVLLEGLPDFPDPRRIWSVVERKGVTLLGLPPTVTRRLMAQGSQWTKDLDLSTLRSFISFSEPMNDEAWWWLYRDVGRCSVPVLNSGGGTEVGGNVLTSYPFLPIKPCAFSGPVVGMDVDVVDAAGASLEGTPGELVIRNLWPGMTQGFWHDRDRYLATYWERLPGIWVHGDIAQRNPDGYWYVHGRSDDLIKVSGRRVGPAEIESALVGYSGVEEVAAIGVPDPTSGEAVICFVVLAPGCEPTPALEEELRRFAGERLGRALAPKKIYFVGRLPKNRTGKILRRVIKARYLGRPLGDLTTLEDPNSIDEVPQER